MDAEESTNKSLTAYSAHKRDILYLKEEKRVADGYRILLVRNGFLDKEKANKTPDNEIRRIALESLSAPQIIATIMKQCAKRELNDDYTRKMMLAMIDARHNRPKYFSFRSFLKSIKEHDTAPNDQPEIYNYTTEQVFRDAFTGTILDLMFWAQLKDAPDRIAKREILKETDKDIGDFWLVGFSSAAGLHALFSENISDYEWIRGNAPNLHKAIMTKAHTFAVFNKDTENFVAAYPKETKEIAKKICKDSLPSFLNLPKSIADFSRHYPKLFAEVKNEIIEDINNGNYEIKHSASYIYNEAVLIAGHFDKSNKPKKSTYNNLLGNDDKDETPEMLQFRLDAYEAMYNKLGGNKGLKARFHPWPKLKIAPIPKRGELSLAAKGFIKDSNHRD